MNACSLLLDITVMTCVLLLNLTPNALHGYPPNKQTNKPLLPTLMLDINKLIRPNIRLSSLKLNPQPFQSINPIQTLRPSNRIGIQNNITHLLQHIIYLQPDPRPERLDRDFRSLLLQNLFLLGCGVGI